MDDMTLNDIAWARLFNGHSIFRRIESDGIFKISADQIRAFREPRLMVKFDHTVNLPKLFFENRLAILPITRGDYAISHFDAYHTFEPDNSPVTRFSLPTHIQSLDSGTVSSEAVALNCAAASGIIAEFLEDTDIVPTVSGRMGSGAFSFRIRDTKTGGVHQLDVNNSQIEIDAAYEGVASLALFEAKRDLSKDFLIRQLYYPFRVWRNRVAKPVRPVFFVYSNGIYRLYEYAFDDPDDYNSLRLVKQKNYSIEETAVSVSDIQAVLDRTVLVEEPEIPFPQADKFERVINLCELVSAQEVSKADVTERYDFDARQADYYADAARYLGLIDKRRGYGTLLYSISETGRRILKLSFKQRQLAYCRLILSHKAFHMALRRFLQRGVMPSTDETVSIMRQSGLYQVGSDSTFVRRSSTIRGWVNWIVSLIDR